MKGPGYMRLLQSRRAWLWNVAFGGTLTILVKNSAGGSSDSPSFHERPSAEPLPKTLDPQVFADPTIRNAYQRAAEIKQILYQQPCYCFCDRALQHSSLLDCFVTDHAAQCNVCRDEALYCYREFRKKRTAAQIRKALMLRKWS